MKAQVAIKAVTVSCLLTFSTLKAVAMDCRNEAQQLVSKSDCYISGSQEACEDLSFIQFVTDLSSRGGGAPAGAAAGAAAGYAAVLFKNRQDMTSSTLAELKKAAPALNRIMSLQADLAVIADPKNNYLKIHDLMMKHPELKNYWASLPANDRTINDVSRKLQNEAYSRLRDIFPENSMTDQHFEKVRERMHQRHAAVEKELRAMNAKYDEKFKTLIKADGSYDKAQVDKVKAEAEKERKALVQKHNVIAADRADFQKFAKQSPANQLYIRLFSASAMDNYLHNVGVDKNIAEFKRFGRVNALKDGARVAATGVLGAMVGAGAGSRGQLDIRLCKEKLNLTEDEVQFLTNGYLLGPAKVYADTSGCEDINIADPEQFIIGARQKFGAELTPALCSIVINQSKKLDSALGGATVNPKVTCDSVSDTNFTLHDRNFEYRDGAKTYKVALDRQTKFPDFKKTNIYNEDGTLDKASTLGFQRKYNNMHPANRANPRADITDIQFAIQKDQKVFPKGLVESSIRARVLSSFQRVKCGSENPANPSSAPVSNSQSSSR